MVELDAAVEAPQRVTSEAPSERGDLFRKVVEVPLKLDRGVFACHVHVGPSFGEAIGTTGASLSGSDAR